MIAVYRDLSENLFLQGLERYVCVFEALVGTEPLLSRNRPYLNSTMLTLLALAGPATPCLEQRTHAFNVLRALFRDACLAESILPYVEQGFIVAIKGFRCKTWSVSVQLVGSVTEVQRSQIKRKVMSIHCTFKGGGGIFYLVFHPPSRS